MIETIHLQLLLATLLAGVSLGQTRTSIEFSDTTGQCIDSPDRFRGAYIVKYSPVSASTEESTWGAIKALYKK